MDMNTVRAFCHWAEHPNTIRWVEKKAIVPLGLAGMSALAVSDTWKAQPEDRKKVIVRDAMVLGATAAGTYAAAMGIRANGKQIFPGLMRYAEEEGRAELKEAIEHSVSFLKEKGYSQGLIEQMEKLGAKTEQWSQVLSQRHGYKEFFKGLQTEFEAKHGSIETAKQEWKNHLRDLMPEEENEGFMEEAKKAASFFLVGGISVLSGLAGGLAANKVNKVKDPNATVNMIKEGIFQFVANIALCAVGAGIALGVVNGEWGPKGNALRQTGDKFADFINKHPAKKLIRTGIIGAGLSIGIFGGGFIANWLGRNYVNPFFDKMQGKTPTANNGLPPEKRKIEFSDAILHLDDVPTAMALAGVKIIEPVIPLFFAFSGYRTGIGYRNDESAKTPPAPMPTIDPPMAQWQQAMGQWQQAMTQWQQTPVVLNINMPQQSPKAGNPFASATPYQPYQYSWPANHAAAQYVQAR